MLDIAEIIDDPDFAESIQIIRVGGSYSTVGLTAGEWIPSHPDPIPAMGVVDRNIQPDRLSVLPEGLRKQQAILVFTRTLLQAEDGDDDPAKTSSDVLVLSDGSHWKVQHLRNWSKYGFCEAIAIQSGHINIGALV